MSNKKRIQTKNFLNKNNNPKYFVDIKISDQHYGSINYKSFSDFKEDGWYVLVNLAEKNYVFISHKDIEDHLDGSDKTKNERQKNIWWANPTRTNVGAKYKITGSDGEEVDIWDESFFKRQ